MANNRLYIADLEKKEYYFVGKGWGSGYEMWDIETIYKFFKTRFMEGEVGQSTRLVFFTEYDELYEDVRKEDSEWDQVCITIYEKVNGKYVKRVID